MKKLIISILFIICLAFGISAFAACGNSGGIGGNSTWNNNVSTENQYNENITYKLSYTSEEECPNGNISDDKLHSSLNFEVDRTYYMVLDFTVLSFPGNWEILQAIVNFDPAEYITARLEEAATGSTGEREENGEKIITASYSIPEQRNEPKSYRVIYKFSGEQNLPEGGISFNIGIAFITTANAIPEFQYWSFNYSEGLIYELNEETSEYTVTGVKNSKSNIFIIPKSHDGKPVTSIGNKAFYNCDGLTSITIPNSVTSIAEDAFEGCVNIKNATIPTTAIKNIPKDNLQTVILTGDNIGWYAFSGCTKLESITIGNGVTSIGGGAFEDTAYYNNPDNWTNDVLYIGNFLIEAKDTLSGSYEIIQSTKLIADYAFEDCGITSITIPDSVTSIGACAFEDCTILTSITIGNGVVFIGDCAFEHCIRLESITIPDGVNSICNDAFKDTAYYNNPNNWTNDVLYIDNYLIKAKDTLSGSYEINQGTKFIADYAFYSCRSLTSITIGNSVISIGDSAFSYCTNLESVTIGNGVTSIGDSAFLCCTSLENITIGNSVTSIGGSAFFSCESLTSVTIPDSVTSIGRDAFYGCTRLESVTLPFVGNGSDKTNFGYIFGTDENLYNSSDVPASLKTVVITGGKSIGDYAFRYCESLTSITIPDSVTSIGQEAFYGCASLENVTLGNNVTSIGDSAFEYCERLTSINIPDSVTFIGIWAFSDCASLANVTFENPNGWYYDYSSNDLTTSGNIPSIDLNNPATAAQYLAYTYARYYWTRKTA